MENKTDNLSLRQMLDNLEFGIKTCWRAGNTEFSIDILVAQKLVDDVRLMAEALQVDRCFRNCPVCHQCIEDGTPHDAGCRYAGIIEEADIIARTKP